MDMEPITLSRHLDRMEAAGMLERHPDPSDRRAHRLYLTESGRELITGFRAHTSHVMREAVDGIAETEIEAMIALLTRMRSNLTGKAGETPEVPSKIRRECRMSADGAAPKVVEMKLPENPAPAARPAPRSRRGAGGASSSWRRSPRSCS